MQTEPTPDWPELRSERLPYYILAHSLRSAHNAGSLLRLVDNFALAGLLLSGFTAGPEHNGFRRAAMQTQEYTPCLRYPTWQDARADFADYPLIALELTAEATSLPEFVWPHQGILVAGSEFHGVPSELLLRADFVISIPMLGRKACLNVSHAVAIALYDLRQKSQGNTVP